MVSLRYDGAGMPDHLRKGMDFDGAVQLKHGETVEVNPDMAGRILASWGTGAQHVCVALVSGEPTPYAPLSATVRDHLRKDADRAANFNLDPARAIVGLPPLSAETKKATAAEIEAGKHDAVLGPLAVWASYDGRDGVAKAAARRGEVLRLAPAKR